MNKRLRCVNFSIFDPENNKWRTWDNMTVLLTEDFIYAIKSEPFYNAVDQKFKESKVVSKMDDEAARNRKFEDCFNEMLDKCPISDELPGVIYSGKILWKIENEEKPYNNQGADIK
ncbi:MAG: hypothetical protein K6B70_00820 [Clostridia bacterium]|nr:hypothetical protein [Clostridia bacterium]